MQFSISNIVAFGMLFAASADALAATRPAAHAPAHTKARQIKHIAYKCPKNANGRECADAIKKLRAKEDNGCDVFGCVVATAATGAACYAAAQEFGFNPLADLACVAASVNSRDECEACW